MEMVRVRPVYEMTKLRIIARLQPPERTVAAEPLTRPISPKDHILLTLREVPGANDCSMLLY